MNMTMGSALPDWLTPVAWTYLALSLASVAILAVDFYLLRHRRDSVVTEVVWLSSALYLGPFALAAYLVRGRTGQTSPRERGDAVTGVLPGGGASAVAHLIAVPLVAAIGWTIAGLAMWPMILVIAVLAVVMLTVYERTKNRDAGGRTGRTVNLSTAVVVALLTVAAFDVGMVGWMLVLHLNDLMPAITEGAFWFLMQVGVIIGLATGYPVVRMLLARDRARSQDLAPA